MNPCWSAGDLRAFLDRELPAGDMEQLSAHLPECGACQAALDELSARAGRVSAMLEELSVGQVSRPAPAGRPGGLPHRWLIPAALAAGLFIAVILRHKDVPQPITQVPPAPQVAQAGGAGLRPARSESAIDGATQGRAPRRPRSRPAARPNVKYFLALDDEPFDTGVVMRVALGPTEIPADVVFSPDGRARAIRLVNYSNGESR